MKRQTLTLILALSCLPLFACGSGEQGAPSHAELALGEANATLASTPEADPLNAALDDSAPEKETCASQMPKADPANSSGFDLAALPKPSSTPTLDSANPPADSSAFSGLDPSSFFGLDPAILSKLDFAKQPKGDPSPAPGQDTAHEKELTDSSQEYSLDACAEANSKKVLVCHVPEGNPEAAHTICVAEEGAEHGHGLNLSDPYAIGGHGGDRLGSCESLAEKVSE